MRLKEFHVLFDALATTEHLRCVRCGGLGRNGCHHLVEDFVPEAITGIPSVGGLLQMLPTATSIRIDPNTGLY